MNLKIAALTALLLLAPGSLLTLVYRDAMNEAFCFGIGLHFGADNVLTVYMLVALFREMGWPWRFFLWFLPVFIVGELILTYFIYLKAAGTPAIWVGISALAGTLFPLAVMWIFNNSGTKK